MPTGGCLFVRRAFSFCLTGIECVFKELFNKFHLLWNSLRARSRLPHFGLAKFSLVNEFFHFKFLFHISDGCSFMAIIRDIIIIVVIIINSKFSNVYTIRTHAAHSFTCCNRDVLLVFCECVCVFWLFILGPWFLITLNRALFEIRCSFSKNVIDLKTCQHYVVQLLRVFRSGSPSLYLIFLAIFFFFSRFWIQIPSKRNR